MTPVILARKLGKPVFNPPVENISMRNVSIVIEIILIPTESASINTNKK